MYSLTLNGMNYCYRKCPINYSTNDNNLKCEKCSNDTIFENGKCVNKCSEPYSRSNIKEINYCLSCNTLQKFVSDGKCIDKCDSNSDLKYEENGICKDSCSFGYVLNGTKCKKCQENGTYYEKGICKDKCSEKLGWNETDNICTNCAEFGYYLEGHKCVINCKQSSRISQDEKLCITCPDNSPYYSAGDCVPKCNNNSILDKFTGYCNFCSDDTNFLDNKCLKSCPEPYISEIIDNRHICSICKKGEWYVARTCQKTCKGGTFSSDDNACHMCYCGRDGRGECNVSDSNKCVNCEMIEDDERETIFDYFGYIDDNAIKSNLLPSNSKSLYDTILRSWKLLENALKSKGINEIKIFLHLIYPKLIEILKSTQKIETPNLRKDLEKKCYRFN